MIQNSTLWMFAIFAVSLMFVGIGIISSRKSPEPKRKLRISKSVAAGVAFAAFALPLISPLSFSYTPVSRLNYLDARNLNSLEQVAAFENEQTRQFEALKQEVLELRAELAESNRFYSDLFRIISIILVSGCLSFIFTNREKPQPDPQSTIDLK